MSVRGGSAVGIIRAVVSAALAERVTFLAAAIAYYAFVSMIPLLVLTIVLATSLGGERAVEALLASIGGFLTPDARGLLADALIGGTGRAGATTASLVVFLWSGLRVFRGLDIAFSQIYGTSQEGSWVEHLSNVFTVLMAVGLGVIVVLFVGTVARVAPGSVPLRRLLAAATMFGSLVVVLFPMYFVFPGIDMGVREALPGTALAALGWTLLATAFDLYASVATSFTIYGVLGGILLLITLLYAGAIVLMVGAVFNAVLSGGGAVRGPNDDGDAFPTEP